MGKEGDADACRYSLAPARQGHLGKAQENAVKHRLDVGHCAGQAGEGVEVGELLKATLARLQGFNVGEHTEVMGYLPDSVPDGADGQEGGDQRAILAALHEFALPHPALSQ